MISGGFVENKTSNEEQQPAKSAGERSLTPPPPPPTSNNIGSRTTATTDLDDALGRMTFMSNNQALLTTPTKKHSASPTWLGSPSNQRSSKRRMGAHHDRFIPDRSGNNHKTAYLLNNETFASPTKNRSKTGDIDIHKEELDRVYSQVLRSEMFGSSYASASNVPHSVSTNNDIQNSSANSNMQHLKSPHKLLKFHPPSLSSATAPATPTGSSSSGSVVRKPRSIRKLEFGPTDSHSSIYSTTSLNLASQKALQSPRKPPRNIPKVPFKILDAPELADDFYLNVVDWGTQSNILAVGLGSSVYLWSAVTGKVNKLSNFGPYDSVTSVNWSGFGNQIAIGTNRGTVQLWDASQARLIRTFEGHTARVGSIAWNGNIMSSGSRDRSIMHHDIRSQTQHFRTLIGHKQEVCGLKWNTAENVLASGGNDNKLMIWDKFEETHLYRLSGHSAAVKAISWNPHSRGIIASGGGTADRKIKFWNTHTGSLLQSVDTGSQVCNLSWSKNSNELVSTHGYSQNQIVVWKYPSMQQVATLTGHTYRVLYLAMSPDGQTVVTGAGDETLRFWNVFAKRKQSDSADSILKEYSPSTIR